MNHHRDILLGSNGEDIVGFTGRVGAFLLTDLVGCVGDTGHLAPSICCALKAGLVSVECDEKLVVTTEEGLQAAGLSGLEPCRVRSYNVLGLIEGARLAMGLERLGYPVYGPREQQALRRAGHELPDPVLRRSGEVKFTCSPGHLLWVDGDSDKRPVSLQRALQRGLPSPGLQEAALALHRSDELAGVIYYVPDVMVSCLEGLFDGGGLRDQAVLVGDSRAAVDAIVSGRRLVIVPENAQAAARRVDVFRLVDDLTRDHSITISYHAAVEAIGHALPEVHLNLDREQTREVIERVVAVALAGHPAPCPDSDAQVNFRATVLAVADELRWHRAETRGASFEHTAERILELPLQESLEGRPLD